MAENENEARIIHVFLPTLLYSVLYGNHTPVSEDMDESENVFW